MNMDLEFFTLRTEKPLQAMAVFHGLDYLGMAYKMPHELWRSHSRLERKIGRGVKSATKTELKEKIQQAFYYHERHRKEGKE